MLLACLAPPKGRGHMFGTEMSAWTSAHAQNRLGFRVLCYGC
jgi:hypothetical protein